LLGEAISLIMAPRTSRREIQKENRWDVHLGRLNKRLGGGQHFLDQIR